MEKRQTTDILIVGGGVIGLSIARALRKRSSASITVVDKGRCGSEASWAAAGMLSPLAEADELGEFYELCSRSRDLYPELAAELLEETAINIGLERSGTLCISLSAGPGQKRLLERYERHRSAGEDVELLPADALREIEPLISREAEFALFYPDDWQVDNRRLVEALVEFARRNEINVVEDTVVDELIAENGNVTGTTALAAGHTVVATGAWTSLIKLGPSPVPVPVRPIRGQIVCYHAEPGLLRHVVYGDTGYLVPRMDGRILAGSTTEDVGFERAVTDDAAGAIATMAERIVPSLSAVEKIETWSGLRPFAPDAMPVIGPLVGVTGLTLATAHYRNGILLAPVTGELAADIVLDGSADELPRSFGPARFTARAVSRQGR